MRISLLLLGILMGVLIGVAAVAPPAYAQNYPWCVISGAYEGGENCGFVTYDQCMATRMGIGGFCVPNTQYRPPPGPAAPAPRRSHN